VLLLLVFLLAFAVDQKATKGISSRFPAGQALVEAISEKSAEKSAEKTFQFVAIIPRKRPYLLDI